MALHPATARHLKGSRNLSDISRIEVGRRGEDMAMHFLLEAGFQILKRNYRNRYGEIDIIASEGATLAFIEVKTRQNTLFGHPLEAVTYKKQLQISKTALEYQAQNGLTDTPSRFDVVAILLQKNSSPKIELIRNAFELSERFS
jgi:putative endonuclease